MAAFNQRGQVLIEASFVLIWFVTLLIAFQMMIDHQRQQSETYRLSKTKKDVLHVEKNENFKSK